MHTKACLTDYLDSRDPLCPCSYRAEIVRVLKIEAAKTLRDRVRMYLVRPSKLDIVLEYWVVMGQTAAWDGYATPTVFPVLVHP